MDVYGTASQPCPVTIHRFAVKNSLPFLNYPFDSLSPWTTIIKVSVKLLIRHLELQRLRVNYASFYYEFLIDQCFVFKLPRAKKSDLNL